MDNDQDPVFEHLKNFFSRVADKFNQMPKGEQLPPLIGLMGQTKSGGFALIPLGLESSINTRAGKNAIGVILTKLLETEPEALPKELIGKDIVQIVGNLILTETWLVEAPISDKNIDIRPSEHKDRKEAIHLNFTPKTGSGIGMFYIIDPETRKVDLNKPVISVDRVESRFDQRDSSERPH